uniref:Uncharacterized protein n=1 Tax=Methylophaga nitratireducenticrescens TaxID=754476 RepID=I1XJR7_METNJ
MSTEDDHKLRPSINPDGEHTSVRLPLSQSFFYWLIGKRNEIQ